MKKTVRVAAVQMKVRWLDPEANAARMKFARFATGAPSSMAP